MKATFKIKMVNSTEIISVTAESLSHAEDWARKNLIFKKIKPCNPKTHSRKDIL